MTIYTYAQTVRLHFEGRCVVGVEYLHQDERAPARVNREVILCGGAVNSPQLPMLSGVGPADQLRALDIPVIADLPGVGQNLQDHLLVGAIYTCTQPISMASTATIMIAEKAVDLIKQSAKAPILATEIIRENRPRP